MAFSKVGELSFTLAAGSSTETKTLPGPPAANDIVLVVMGNDAAFTTTRFSTSGYVDIETGLAATTPSYQTAYKLMGGTPDTTVVLFQLAANITAGLIQVWRGEDTTTPEDVGNVTDLGTTGMPNPTSITTVTDGALVVAMGLLDDDDVASSVTAPAGYTDLLASDTGQASTTVGCTVMIASKIKTPAGAENPGLFGGTGTDAWRSVTMALRPSAGGGEPAAAVTTTILRRTFSDLGTRSGARQLQTC